MKIAFIRLEDNNRTSLAKMLCLRLSERLPKIKLSEFLYSEWGVSRIILGRSRIIKNLERLTVANWRTLEQKISDAGPSHMRVDPHILTDSKRSLINEKHIIPIKDKDVEWYILPETPQRLVDARLAEVQKIYRALSREAVRKRIGQSLEIAFYLAARNCPEYELLGGIDLSSPR